MIEGVLGHLSDLPKRRSFAHWVPPASQVNDAYWNFCSLREAMMSSTEIYVEPLAPSSEFVTFLVDMVMLCSGVRYGF